MNNLNKSALAWLIASRHIVLLGVILTVATGFRTFKLGEVPYGLNQDEVSTAYDAYAIGYFGIDRMGHSLPLFLESWGNGMQALSSYVLVPFYYVFGVSVFTFRGVGAFMGILSVLLVYLLCSEIFTRRQGLVSAFLVAISPWHIMQSRWFFEASSFPFFFLAALTVFVMAAKRKSFFGLCAASALFGACMYTYGPAHVVVPIFFSLACLHLLVKRNLHQKDVIMAFVLFCACTLPLAYYFLVNSFGFPQIDSVISIPQLSSEPRYESLVGSFSFAEVSRRLLQLFTMLLNQRDDLPYNAMPVFGIMYPFAWAAFCSGIAVIVTSWWRKKNAFIEIILIAIIPILLMASLIDVNLNRANVGVLLFLIVSTIGVGFFMRLHWALSMITVCVYAALSLQFAAGYFGDYQLQTGPHFFSSFTDAMKRLDKAKPGNVCITDTVKMPYIYVLYFYQIDPHIFVDTVAYVQPGEEFQRVKSFDRFTFGLANCDVEMTDVFLLSSWEASNLALQNMEIRDFGDFIAAYK
jgi:4-amino-4-deoxy-L-arabinose transferase-like glycosyltransferase